MSVHEKLKLWPYQILTAIPFFTAIPLFHGHSGFFTLRSAATPARAMTNPNNSLGPPVFC